MSWDNNNKANLASCHSTSDGTKRTDSDGYSWSNYSGVKGSRDVNVNQMNSKDYEGSHTFYSPKSGAQGVKGPHANDK